MEVQETVEGKERRHEVGEIKERGRRKKGREIRWRMTLKDREEGKWLRKEAQSG